MLRTPFIIALSFIFILTVQAQRVVNIKVGTDASVNASLLYRGITGNTELDKAIARDLRNCGWFDLVSSGYSNYIVSGSAAGNSVRLQLSDGAGAPLATVTATEADVERTSHKAVDALLKYLYKIPGICATKILFVAQTLPMQKEIYLCNYDGTGITQLTRNGGLSLDPVWGAGGKTFIYSFVGRTYTSLIEQAVDSKRSRRLARFSGLNAGGKISPDGTRVALILSKDNQVDLYVRSVNGGDLKRLTNDKSVEASPCWSPDGTKLCYVSDAGASHRPRLRVISAAGGTPTTIPGILGSESVSPSWSRDGKIAYSAKLGNYTVAVIDPANRRPDRYSKQKYGIIADKGGDWESPSWAPDNRHVVCSFRYGIYIVDTWTGKSRQILGGKSRLSLPDWSGILY